MRTTTDARFARAVNNISRITHGLVEPVRFTANDFEPVTQPAPHWHKPIPLLSVAVTDITIINIFCERCRDAQRVIHQTMLAETNVGDMILVKCVKSKEHMTQKWEYRIEGQLYTYIINWVRPTELNCRSKRGTVAFIHDELTLSTTLLFHIRHSHQELIGFGRGGAYWE